MAGERRCQYRGKLKVEGCFVRGKKIKKLTNKFLQWLGLLVAGCLTLTAILLLLLHLVNPDLQHYRLTIEQMASQMMSQPIKIGSIDVGTYNFEPVLNFKDVTVFNDDGKTILVTVRKMQIGIDIFGSIIKWHIVPGLLVVKGAEVSLEETSQGEIKFLDLKTLTGNANAAPTEFANMLEWILTQGRIELEDFALTWKPYGGDHFKFTNVYLSLSNHVSLHNFIVSGMLAEGKQFADFHADLRIDGDVLQHQALAVNGELALHNIKLKFRNNSPANNFLRLWRQGDIEIQGGNIELDFGDLFRKPLLITACSSELSWQRNQDTLQIQAKQIKAQNKQLLLRGSLGWEASLQTYNPQIDAVLDFALIDLAYAKDYYPLTLMPKSTVAWLNAAVLSGEQIFGTVTLQGPFNKFPFANHEGRFLVDAYVQAINLDYQKNWPVLKNASGRLVFEGKSMLANIDTAKILAIPVAHVDAKIADLANPYLEISGGFTAKASDALAFIDTSPLHKTVGRSLQGAKISGPMQLDLKLNIPLDSQAPDSAKTTVAGAVTLQNNRLQLTAWQLDFLKLNGILDFNENGLRAPKLTAELFNHPVVVNIKTVNAASNDSITQFTANGSAAIDALQNLLGSQATAHLGGAINYLAILNLHNNPQANNSLLITSDLNGTAIDLPDPFGKTLKDRRPFKLNYIFGASNRASLLLAYADKLSAALTFNKNKYDVWQFFSGELKLNSLDASLQPSPGLVVTGKLDKVDASVWQNYLLAKDSLGSAANYLRKVGLDVNELNIWGQSFANIALRAALSRGDNIWQVSVNNPKIQGDFTVPKNLFHAQIQGGFARLYLAKDEQKFATIKPQNIPALNFWVDDFRYNNSSFGRVELDTVPQLNGLRINSLVVKTPDFKLAASGRWMVNDERQRTFLSGNFTSPDLGTTLKNLDIAEGLVGGVAEMNFAVNWPAAPYKPSLQALDGTLTISVQRGRITNLGQTTDAKLGFGRVLSLLSLQTLPRRLTLDFSDLFKEGFSFDTLRGDAELLHGDAVTNEIILDGPTAQVKVKGRIGLWSKTYDLILKVTPHITSSIPVIATIVGSPVAGLATWVAEKVVDAGMRKVVGYTYKVTGSWQNPSVE